MKLNVKQRIMDKLGLVYKTDLDIKATLLKEALEREKALEKEAFVYKERMLRYADAVNQCANKVEEGLSHLRNIDLRILKEISKGE